MGPRRCRVASYSIALTSLRSSVSGGFAVVQPDSALSINAVEAYPLEDFSADVSCGNEENVLIYFFDPIFQLQAVKSQIAEAQKIANGSGSEQDIAEAKIELEVGQPRTR